MQASVLPNGRSLSAADAALPRNKQPMNVLTIPENLKTNSPVDRITAVAKSEKGNDVAIGTAGLGVFWQNIQNGDYKNWRSNQSSNSISSNGTEAFAGAGVGKSFTVQNVVEVTGKKVGTSAPSTVNAPSLALSAKYALISSSEY